MNLGGLYLIITDPIIGYQKLAEIAVSCEVSLIQLRIKDNRINKVKIANDIKNITNGTQTRLIINDDINLAIEIDADGVHLGQDDCLIEKAKNLWKNKNKIFGISTHNQDQAIQAEKNGASYIGIGPIFPTSSKKNLDPLLGITNATKINDQCNCPTFSIGGINLKNLRQIKSIKSCGFCVLGAVNNSKEPEKVIKSFKNEWESINF